MPGLQELIHKLEVGEGTRYIKIVAALLALLVLTVVYHTRETTAFATPTAMDQAQLGRNLATGHGYTTLFVRPLSLHLLEEQAAKQPTRTNDLGRLKAPHPDLANAPLFPLLLAGAMKVLPFKYEILRGGEFSRYQPEMLIAFLNQGLFFLAAFLLYRLARRLFDTPVAAISVIVFLGAEIYWQFTVSGLPTMLALVVVLLLARVLAAVAQAAHTEGPETTEAAEVAAAPRGPVWFAGMAVLAGFLVAVAALTTYALGWLIVPVAVWFALCFPGRRTVMSVGALVAFLLAMAPWAGRNYQLSGHLFGTAGLAVTSESRQFTEDRLERSLTPNFSKVEFEEILRKLVVNVLEIAREDLPKLGGNWVVAFFLVGLMLPFRNPALNRLRLFVLLAGLTLTLAQALGRTHLSGSPYSANGVHVENLLVLLAPLAFVFGVALYFILLEQLPLPFPEARQAVHALFCLVACGPFLLTVMPPKAKAAAFPPYWPPLVQQLSGWTRTNDLMMSDVPWAVAWYGQRQCVWTVLDVERDFYAINDFRKPVNSLYLTQLTTDAKFFSQMTRADDRNEHSWAWFLYQTRKLTTAPPGFPLKQELPLFPDYGQVFMADRVMWPDPK